MGFSFQLKCRFGGGRLAQLSFPGRMGGIKDHNCFVLWFIEKKIGDEISSQFCRKKQNESRE